MPQPDPRPCPECGAQVAHGNLARHRRRRHWCRRCQDHHLQIQADRHYQRPVTVADGEALVGYLARHGFEELGDNPWTPDTGNPLAPPAEPAGFSPRSTGSAGGASHAPRHTRSSP
jgi:endogenous inhibitor of DNA gyrase (YacG/DUF329 family)